jgi:uncharacterized protein YbjT (DUF2867 family)
MTERDNTTILVTTATGNIGSEIVKQLAARTKDKNRNVRVRAAVRSINKVPMMKGLGVELTEIN